MMMELRAAWQSTVCRTGVTWTVTLMALSLSAVHAQSTGDPALVSPALLIDRDPVLTEITARPAPPRDDREVRSIDGRGNNKRRPEMGATLVPLMRIGPIGYADGKEQMRSRGLPGARELSNAFATLPPLAPATTGASDMLWQWGQFLDHDLSLTDGTDPAERADIEVPAGDHYFDPDWTNTAVIPFNRSLYEPGSGTSRRNPRQQLNEITTWIDASQVYGSDADRANALRVLDGSGRLATSDDDFLPYNTGGLSNAGGNGAHLFLAGDVRSNEQLGLTVMHTLFVREHNRLVKEFASADGTLDGDALYAKARRTVGGQLQFITYEEFLPVLVGRRSLSRYRGYRPRVDASLSNLFSTALYRWGHSALGDSIARLDAQGRTIDAGHLALRDAFFAPSRLAKEGGIEPILRGLTSKVANPIDLRVVDDVRNFLFGEPGQGGFDLVALNVQRGRDHGLASYNQARLAFGLRPRRHISEVSPDPAVTERLAAVYRSVDDIDAWIGALAEKPRRGTLVGPLLRRAMIDQFERLRDGDRFWYERNLAGDERAEIAPLASIIRRNTGIGNELSDTPFVVK